MIDLSGPLPLTQDFFLILMAVIVGTIAVYLLNKRAIKNVR